MGDEGNCVGRGDIICIHCCALHVGGQHRTIQVVVNRVNAQVVLWVTIINLRLVRLQWRQFGLQNISAVDVVAHGNWLGIGKSINDVAVAIAGIDGERPIVTSAAQLGSFAHQTAIFVIGISGNGVGTGRHCRQGADFGGGELIRTIG